MIQTYETGGGVAIAGLVTQIVTGVGKVGLDYMDAFCATTRCKEAKRQRAADLEIAKMSLEVAKLEAAGAGAAAARAKRTQNIVAVVGIGILGLGAWYLAGRQ